MRKNAIRRLANNQLMNDNRGSHRDKKYRHFVIHKVIHDLFKLELLPGKWYGLNQEHIRALVLHWKSQNKSPATIKNYMSKLRTTARLLDKANLIKPDNAAYHIDKRSYAPTQNKAIHQIDLTKCTDPYIRLSLEGQALFGLRREESMKFTVRDAVDGDTIIIKPSWTKGGIGRTVDITNDAQREWLNKVARLVPPGQSLIPQDRSYKSASPIMDKEYNEALGLPIR